MFHNDIAQTLTLSELVQPFCDALDVECLLFERECPGQVVFERCAIATKPFAVIRSIVSDKVIPRLYRAVMLCLRFAFSAEDAASIRPSNIGSDINSSQQLRKVSNITFSMSTIYVLLALLCERESVSSD